LALFWAQIAIVVFLGGALLVAIGNVYSLRRLGSYPPPERWPRVSILVPARNEEANIESCAGSLLGQDYPDFELLILDDNSEDRTPQILAAVAAHDRRLRIRRGQPLPEGWLGKHWACQQLLEAADGELVFYTDADTHHSPGMLRAGVAALLAENADMLCGLPQEETGSWSERLVIPMMQWGVLAFLPLWLAYRWRAPILSTATGQFMLFKRASLRATGGFAAVRADILDDIALARRIKHEGYRWRLVSARAFTHCRMYHNLREVIQGFGKNFSATIGNNTLLFALIWTWLAYAFLEPVVLLALWAAGVPFAPGTTALAGLAVLISLLLWAISDRRFGFPVYRALLYPLTMLISAAIALLSLAFALTGRASWKGRIVETGPKPS